MSSKSEITVKYTDVNVASLGFTPFDEDNQRSKGQKIAFIRYINPKTNTEGPLIIQLPWIHMKSGGVPKLGEYFSDDSQRSFVKVPIDLSLPEMQQLADLFKNIDKMLDSDDFRKKTFGAKASKYVYQPSFRIPLEDDDDNNKDKKKNYGPKHPYIKLKIDTTYPDNQIKTILFSSTMDNGKRVRNKIENVKSIDDFASHVCWMSRIHPIVRPVKLWAQNPSKKDPTYGLTFKIIKVEVEAPPKQSSSFKQYLEADTFLDSDKESDTPVTLTKTPITVNNKAEMKAESESESESDSEINSKMNNLKVEPVEKSLKTVRGKQIVQVDSDSNSESDDESDQESDEEIKPAKKVVKAAPKTTRTKKTNNNP